MRVRLGRLLPLPLLAAFLGLLLVWPLADTVARGLREPAGPAGPGAWTLRYVREIFADPLQFETVLRSAGIAAGVTALSAALALPLALLMARRAFAGKTLLGGLLLLPMILPPFVGAVGMRMLLARFGPLTALCNALGFADGPVDWLGRFPLAGVVGMEALHLFPILYLNLVAAFAAVDPTLEEAARNLGAPPVRVFRRVTLPLAAPGFFAGLTLVFVWAFTELGTPLVFGVRGVLPVRIYDGVSEIGTNPLGAAQVTVLLAATLIGFALAKAVGRRDVASLNRLSAKARETPLSAGRTVFVWAACAFLLLLAALPHLGVLLLAVAGRTGATGLPEGWTLAFFDRALTDELARTGLGNSLILALAATALDAILGLALAWLCVRGRVRGAGVLDALAMLPLAVPGLVLAFGLLGCYGGCGPAVAEAVAGAAAALGWRGEGAARLADLAAAACDPRKNPMFLLALSYAVRRLPYMLRAAHAGLEQTSVSLEEAAANLGASPGRVLRRVTLPLISGHLLAGGILCFCFALLEVSDSLILAQSEPFYPLTKAIYALIDGLEGGLHVAAALGLWATALLAAGLLWASVLLGRKAGRLFR